MISLNPHDLHWALARLPKPVIKAMERNRDTLFLAGGYIRSVIAHETVNDIDLFVPSVDHAGSAAMLLADNDPHRIYKTENAFTIRGYGTPIQIIFRWTFATPEACVESFDFTIAKAAIFAAAEGFKGICHESFYQDLASKRLIYTSPVRNEDAGGSMLRLLKFYQRGYRTPLSSLGAVIARMLKGVDEANWEKRAFMEPDSWEQQMGAVLTGLLREVDPAIDPAHIAHLSDPTPPENIAQ